MAERLEGSKVARVTTISDQGVVYDLSDMSEYELRYLLSEPCTCTRGHVTGDGIDAYTCFAHRAQAELDRRSVGTSDVIPPGATVTGPPPISPGGPVPETQP